VAFALVVLLVPATARCAGAVLRVSFNELPPWKALGPKGEPTGVDVEFLNVVAGRMGLQVEYVHYPFKRGLKMLELGEVDMMTGVLRRPEREAYLHFIEPPYKNRSSKAFFVLKGREHSITRHEDLHGLRVGTGLGGRYYPCFDDDDAIEKFPVAAQDLCFRMLAAGRVDAVIMTETAGDYRVAQYGYGGRIVKADYVHRDPQGVYLVLSKRSRHAARLEEFGRVARELMDAGVLDEIMARFLRTVMPSSP
jgi:polar amino acid transport system substrate-binding protein